MSKIVKYTELKKTIEDLWNNKIKTNFITDITYSSTDKKLKKTKNGAETEITKIITDWDDLEYTTHTQSNNYNIFNPSTFKDGEYYNSLGTFEKTPDWGNFKIPCSGGETFTLFKKTHDSINLALINGDIWVQNLAVSHNNDNGWIKYTINIPANVQIDSISIPVHNRTNNYKSDVMIFSGNINAPNKYIPFTNSREVSVNGEKVAITFDSSNTTLTSSTTVDAIKELDSKIINAGTVKSVNGQNPNPQGAVTVNAEHIGYNGNTSNIIATNVQDAIDKLKEDVVLIDGAEIYIKANKAELDNFLGSPNTLKHGDLIYIIDSTDVVDFTGKLVNGGNPVAMIFDDSLNTGNELRVFSKFSSNVNVSANNVSYNDAQTQLNAQNVQDAIQALNDKKIDTTKIGNTNGQIPQIGAGDKLEVSIIPNIPISNVTSLQTELDNKVVTVNNQPNIGGNVTVNAGQILAVVGNQPPNNVQVHLNNLHTNIENNSRRITTLETRGVTTRVGEVITVLTTNGADFVDEGCTFMYMGGRDRVLTRTGYPQLATALGIPTNINNFNLPRIDDTTLSYDNGLRSITRKSFICVHKA